MEVYSMSTKNIYLAGGCFWGTEKVFKLLNGVLDTTVGYANGHTQNPTYQEVCTDRTGHRETVRVTYDPQQITLKKILTAYFMVKPAGRRYRNAVPDGRILREPGRPPDHRDFL